MRKVQLQLFGDFCLTYDGKPITNINTPRLRALVAYLALHSRTPPARHHLAFLFWPDSNEAQALTNLRKQLLYLCRALPDAAMLLYTTRHMMQWSPSIENEVDVDTFEETLTRATAATDEQTINLLRYAVDIYRGDLLPECYDEWIFPLREALREKYSNGLMRLVQRLEERRDYTTALFYAQQLLRHDPLHEPTYRQLMRLYALDGDRAMALRIYHTCVTQLREELGVEPSAETQAAYESLLQQSAVLELAHPLVANAPLVGRQPAWQKFQQAWHKTAHTAAQFMLITGEAGIGKTRLAEEMLDWATHQGFATARTRSYAAEGRLAYAPVIELLRADALHRMLRHLEATWLTEIARLLPELLTAQPTLPHPEPLAQNWQRLHLFEALTRAILAGDKPRVLLFDDLQWCDQETLEWLHFLLRFALKANQQHHGRARFLIIGTVRTEEINIDHPLTALVTDLRGGNQLTEIDLTPLTVAETAELAGSIALEALDERAIVQLYRNTEGNPLFVVETMRMGHWQSALDSTNDQLIPATDYTLSPKIQAVIQSRLAQLSPSARQVATLAAIIGREFTFDVLRAASQQETDLLVDALDELWQRRIIRERGTDAYDFSHDRIRDVAAAGVSRIRRRYLHRSIAEALESQHAAQLDSVAAQIAAQYEAAGMPEQAIRYYERAAQAGLRIYANQEAITYLNRAFALLHTLPPSQAHAEWEYRLLVMIGPPLVARQGYGSEQLYKHYLAALHLSEQLKYPIDPAILRLLAIYHVARRQFDLTYNFGLKLRQIAQIDQQTVEPFLYVESCYTLGVAAFWQGHFQQARHEFELGIAAYDQQLHATNVARYGQDPGVACLSRLAWSLWYLGYPEQALARSRQALALANLLKHPFSVSYAFLFMEWLAYDAQDQATATELAESLITYQTQFEFSLANQAIGMVCRGKRLVDKGQAMAGIEIMRAGIAMASASQYELMFGLHFQAMLAQALMTIGDFAQADEAIHTALRQIDNYHDRYYEAEIQRLRGELLLAKGIAPEDAEAYFCQSLQVARQQQAKSLQLRTAISLSRLWVQKGRREEAHTLLAEIYSWFTEGFAMPDLQAAKALLDQLA